MPPLHTPASSKASTSSSTRGRLRNSRKDQLSSDDGGFHAIARTVGDSAVHRFGSVQEAFRTAATNHRGELTRADTRGLLCGQLGLPLRDADQLFDGLGGSRTGVVSAADLRHVASPALQNSRRLSCAASSSAPSLASGGERGARLSSPGSPPGHKAHFAWSDAGSSSPSRGKNFWPTQESRPPQSAEQLSPGLQPPPSHEPTIREKQIGNASSNGRVASGGTSTALRVADPLAHVIGSSGRPQPEKKLSQEEFDKVIDLIGKAVGSKYRSVREAFLKCDEDYSGEITRQELSKFLKNFGFASQAKADQVFDHLDRDCNGMVSMEEVRHIFGPYIQPGHESYEHHPDNWHTSGGTDRLVSLGKARTRGGVEELQKNPRPASPPPPKLSEKEFSALLQKVCVAAASKYTTVHRAFRHCDVDRSGMISRDEMGRFLRNFGFASQMQANQFFDHLDKDGSGSLSLDELRQTFGPYIQPGHEEYECLHDQWHTCAGTDRLLALGKSRTPNGISSIRENAACLSPAKEPKQPLSRRPPKNLTDADFSRITDMVRKGMSQRAKSTREAFEFVDTDRDGMISREEVGNLLLSFGIEGKIVADQFFDRLDKNGDGHLDVKELQGLFGNHLKARPDGNQPVHGASPTRSFSPGLERTNNSGSGHIAGNRSPILRSPQSPRSFDLTDMNADRCRRHLREDGELKQLVEKVHNKTESKAGGVRKALQIMSRRPDGTVTRDQVGSFLRNNGLFTNGEADRFFERLDEEKRGYVDYNDFRACFGPTPNASGQSPSHRARERSPPPFAVSSS